MKRKYGYLVEHTWDRIFEDNYSICPATKKDIALDGMNYVGKGGFEGLDVYVVNSFLEAIFLCHCVIDKINFFKLNGSEKNIIKQFNKTYQWNEQEGHYIPKEAE